jgi:transposase-like protein
MTVGAVPACWPSERGVKTGLVMEGRIDDRDWCAARLAAGDTVAAIGVAAGVSRQTASAWIKRHKLQANHQPRERPDEEQMAGDYERTRSIRKLAAEYGISSGVMQTWLFEAGITPLGTPGRPAMDIDLDVVRARRDRGETWAAVAEDLGVSGETLRRRVERSD